jgi:hypothetical protein
MQLKFKAVNMKAGEVMIPFSKQEFFQIFEAYNSSVGVALFFFYATALISIFALARGKRQANLYIFGTLAFLWMWMGVVYHWFLFNPINTAAWIF